MPICAVNSKFTLVCTAVVVALHVGDDAALPFTQNLLFDA